MNHVYEEEVKYHWFKTAVNGIDKTPFTDDVKFALAQASMEIIGGSAPDKEHHSILSKFLGRL